MKKKTMVSIVASSLLLAPFVLNQVVAADENVLETSNATEVVNQASSEPVTSSESSPVVATVAEDQGTNRPEATSSQLPASPVVAKPVALPSEKPLTENRDAQGTSSTSERNVSPSGDNGETSPVASPIAPAGPVADRTSLILLYGCLV